jgi:hypothetical protein
MQKHRTIITVILILIIGFLIRLTGREWDQGSYMHPDERFVAIVLDKVTIPESFAQYIDPATSTLSPYNHDISFYVYGGLPITLVKATAVTLDQMVGEKTFDTYGKYYLIGRTYNEIFDMASALMVFFIAKKFFSEKSAIISLVLYSITVMVIQQSNFFTMDIFANFFITAGIKFVLDIIYAKGINEQIKNIIISAIFVGAAIASKMSSIIVLPFILFVFIAAFARQIKLFKWKQIATMSLKYLLLGLFMLLLIYLVMRLAQPFIFADSDFFNLSFNKKFLDAMDYQYKLGTGELTAPFTMQWFTSTRFLTPLWNLSIWAIGLPIMLSCLGGITVYLSQIRKTKIKIVVIKGLLLLYLIYAFIYFGNGFIKYIRYFLPIVPVIILFAGEFISYLDDHKNINLKRLAAFLLIASEIWAIAFISIYFQTNTRTRASQWFYQNIPEGVSISHEVWDDSVPYPVPNVQIRQYITNEIDMYREDNSNKISYLFEYVEKTDYIVLASSRQSASVGNLPTTYPITTKFYKALFSGKLGYSLVHKEGTYPSLLGFEFNDELAEESFFIYDHPTIWIFKKTNTLTENEFRLLVE